MHGALKRNALAPYLANQRGGRAYGDRHEHVAALAGLLVVVDDARRLWEGLGLPKSTPEAPSYGYDLGPWNTSRRAHSAQSLLSE